MLTIFRVGILGYDASRTPRVTHTWLYVKAESRHDIHDVIGTRALYLNGQWWQEWSIHTITTVPWIQGWELPDFAPWWIESQHPRPHNSQEEFCSHTLLERATFKSAIKE